jgi:curved DNA-binding protein CbpA
MFIDYYQILEIDIAASDIEIKNAYKKQALRWHPDRNSGSDTISKMQSINEAYLILKDSEAKSRYDNEYKSYKSFVAEQNSNEYYEESKAKQEYQFSDETLKRWMNNAKQQASKLASASLHEFKTGAKAAGKEMIERTVGFLIVGIIFSIIVLAGKSCT